MEANKYPVNVFWSDEDEGYIAVATDLPGCSAYGASPQEAIAEVQSAIEAWLEAARAAGNDVPAPSNPAADPPVSGKYLLRMPRSLHWHLVQAAKRERVSLNQHMVYLLTTGSYEQKAAHISAPTAPTVIRVVGWGTTSTASKIVHSSGDARNAQVAVNRSIVWQ